MKKKDGKKMMADGPKWAEGPENMKMKMGEKKGDAKMGKMKMSKGKKACKM